MKKIYYYAFVILLVTGTYFYTNWKYSLENIQKDMLDEQKQQSYSGVILKKYTEEDGKHPKRFLKLKNGTVATPIRKVWDKTTTGDSIVKIKDSDYVTIYKKNDSIITFSYTDWLKEE